MREAAPTTETRLTSKRIDCILYNRRAWRDLVEQLEPGISVSVVMVHVTGGPADSRVERIAVKRATVSLVLDTVDRAIRRMPRDLRAIDKLKYRQGYTLDQIGRRLNYSRPTVERRVKKLRELIQASLMGLPGTIVADFWREIDGFLMCF